MENLIITVNRECGTGGRTIAQKIGERLGLKVYDRHVLDAIAEQFGMSVENIEKVKAQKTSWWEDICRFYKQFGAIADNYPREVVATPLSIFSAERRLLLDIAEKEPCVIVGRAGFHIFRDHPTAIHILFIADMESRVKRICRVQNCSEDEARQLIERLDNERDTFVQTVANVSRYDARNYDLVVNVAKLDPDKVVDFIANQVELKF